MPLLPPDHLPPDHQLHQKFSALLPSAPPNPSKDVGYPVTLQCPNSDPSKDGLRVFGFFPTESDYWLFDSRTRTKAKNENISDMLHYTLGSFFAGLGGCFGVRVYVKHRKKELQEEIEGYEEGEIRGEILEEEKERERMEIMAGKAGYKKAGGSKKKGKGGKKK